MQQHKQAKEPSRLKQIRYRKLNMAGGTTLVTFNNCSKPPTKGTLIEFPLIDTSNQEEGLQGLTLDLKKYQEQLSWKKNNKTVKTLMKVYEDTRRRNSQSWMNMLGLDIKKISYIANNFTGQKQQPGQRASFSKTNRINLRSAKKSPYARNLSDRKENTRRESEQAETIQHEGNSLCKIGKMEMAESAYLMRKKVDDTDTSPSKQAKKKYLYQKLAGLENNGRDECNYIYDKRIKSYTDFLFKLQYSHGIYINLDLMNEELGSKSRRLKYYVGPGNNCAMIRGLLKRRYWWVASEDRTQCSFVWTQIKVNSIYDKQRRAQKPQPTYNDCSIRNEEDEDKQIRKTASTRKQASFYDKSHKGSSPQQNCNGKVLNREDEAAYSKYIQRHQANKERTYAYRVEKVEKVLAPNQNEDSLVHNHLENNFYLGNKKALFYNLKQYYELIGEDVFSIIPLTFHIKKGLKDPEYKRFVAYYNRRKAQIKNEQKKQQQQGVSEKKKTRNIWIVKPGENSNQGRGITVIDQIYELNNIIKRIGEKKPSSGSSQQPPEVRTYIVQMYIDRPLLYNNRKFDIRHYMLITNLYGVMRAYWYAEGYIRTSSYEFKIEVFEPEIHLTNDAVQKKYAEYGRYEPYNKVSYQEFQRYLDSAHPTKKYDFKCDILPQMKKMGTDAAKSVFTKISPRNQMHNFEIFGLDFMIDKNFRPWLIEINTNPCLDCACPLLDRIIPYMVEQSLKLSLDVVYPPPAHYPNTCKHFAPLVNLDAFKYQLIFDSQVEGEELRALYKKAKGNLIAQIGEIEQDEEFKDDGKEIKLDDFA